ncbi:MAG: formate--phosphoribosylaminoimidazolecarboxamide ligase family protein [Thermoproteota archaeon]
MISQNHIQNIVKEYDNKNITIATLGSHSALDILDGAKDEGFKTLVVCQKGRERPYQSFTRIVDELIILDKFNQVADDSFQKKLIEKNVIFVPHRSFTTYVDYSTIENNFNVPLFGSRNILRSEERNAPKNQYYLLEKGGINYPRIFQSPEEIDRLSIVKVMESTRKIERAFFTASSYDEFQEKANKRIDEGIITEQALKESIIEEFIVGTYFNFNFFFSPVKNEVEFLGIDRRLQTNLNDFTSLPAAQQLELNIQLQNIEIGHMPATVRESLLEKVFDIGERFVKATKDEYPPGIIGPFALQSAITKDLNIFVFDVSPRVPGSPVLMMSPYTHYYHGESFGTGRRIAMEIKDAITKNKLQEVVT